MQLAFPVIMLAIALVAVIGTNPVALVGVLALMLSEGRDYLTNAWWLASAPGVMISLVVLGANLLGDGLRDLLDPHLG